MNRWPRHPVIYEIHTWAWLAELSRRAQRPVTLEPGERYSITVNLNEFVEFRSAGLYTVQGLFSAFQEQANVSFCIMNNSAYAALTATQLVPLLYSSVPLPGRLVICTFASAVPSTSL